MNIKQRFSNALWAQAVCDAVGDPFEFNPNPDPFEVIQYANESEQLMITDDTQMALFMAEALNGFVCGVNFDSAFKSAFIDWYQTQTQHPLNALDAFGLASFQSLYHRRAPGNTCLESCQQILQRKPVRNNSKGCGSVMRILPFSIIHDVVDSKILAIRSAEMTHQHSENAVAVSRLMGVYRDAINHNEIFAPWSEVPDSISDLGEGWTALECVNMAIYANQCAETFDDLLTLSICHNGDSDSVAAVAGSIWGLCGKDVPNKYKHKIVESGAINYILGLDLYKE